MSTLALSMIVKDAAKKLAACLESARGVVDEVLIADTGSTDGTIEEAKRLGARVVSIPWTNHFAEARNRALQEVQSDWVLALDADEQLDGSGREQIRPLLERRSAAGFLVTIRNYVLSPEERVWDRPAKLNDSLLPASCGYPAYVEHENVRLFRRDKEIYFVGRVHESVGPRIQQLGRPLEPAPFCIHHFGMAIDAETRAKKNNYYRELGRAKLRDMPRNAQAHLELGLVELDNFRSYAEALSLFERACDLDPQMGVAWFFAGLTLVKLERYSAAVGYLAEAEKNGHGTALVAETRGDALYNLKDLFGARKSYQLALRRDPSNLLLESKLGLAEVRTGKTSEGLTRLQEAIKKKPKLRELHDRLILALVSLDLIEEAAAASEKKLASVENPEACDFLRAASLEAKAGHMERAASVLQNGLQHDPQNEKLQQALREVSPQSEQTKLQVV